MKKFSVWNSIWHHERIFSILIIRFKFKFDLACTPLNLCPKLYRPYLSVILFLEFIMIITLWNIYYLLHFLQVGHLFPGDTFLTLLNQFKHFSWKAHHHFSLFKLQFSSKFQSLNLKEKCSKTYAWTIGPLDHF